MEPTLLQPESQGNESPSDVLPMYARARQNTEPGQAVDGHGSAAPGGDVVDLSAPTPKEPESPIVIEPPAPTPKEPEALVGVVSSAPRGEQSSNVIPPAVGLVEPEPKKTATTAQIPPPPTFEPEAPEESAADIDDSVSNPFRPPPVQGNPHWKFLSIYCSFTCCQTPSPIVLIYMF